MLNVLLHVKMSTTMYFATQHCFLCSSKRSSRSQAGAWRIRNNSLRPRPPCLPSVSPNVEEDVPAVETRLEKGLPRSSVYIHKQGTPPHVRPHFLMEQIETTMKVSPLDICDVVLADGRHGLVVASKPYGGIRLESVPAVHVRHIRHVMALRETGKQLRTDTQTLQMSVTRSADLRE